MKLWYSAKARQILYQALALLAFCTVLWFLAETTRSNLEARNIATGFDFLAREAGFAISESIIPYHASNSYGYALLVGILNTLKVFAVGIVLTTILGVGLGIARLHQNPLLSYFAAALVEAVRNVPLLLQLFLWYGIIKFLLPIEREALEVLPHTYLSNRGIKYPGLDSATGFAFTAYAFLGLLALTIALKKLKDGQYWRRAYWLLWPVVLVAVFILYDQPQVEIPVKGRFNYQGGAVITPEFIALTIGLVVYSACFIAEIVRSGIQSVPQGQWEAAHAMTLSQGQTLRYVILPQALKLIIPPLNSQYLNLLKNSSLAVAIGYPDLVSIANITINQTGQAIEGVLMIMLAYLTLNLTISALMNWYNNRIQGR